MIARLVPVFALWLGSFSQTRAILGGVEKLSLIWPTFRNSVGSDGRTTLPGPGTTKPVLHLQSVFPNSTVRTSVVLGRAGNTALAVVSTEDNRTAIVSIGGGVIHVVHTLQLEHASKSLGACPPSKIPPSPVLLSNGLAIVVSSMGYLVAIDVLTGKQMAPFSVSDNAPVCVSPTISKGGSVLYAVTSDGTLAAFAASDIRNSTKDPVWKVSLKGRPVSMPTVGPIDGSIYIALTSTQILIVNQGGKIFVNKSSGFPITTAIGVWKCEVGKVYYGIHSEKNYTCDGHKNIGIAFFVTTSSVSISDLDALRSPSKKTHLHRQSRRQLLRHHQRSLSFDGLQAYSSPTMFITTLPKVRGVVLFVDTLKSIEAEDFVNGTDIWTIDHLDKDTILSSPAVDKNEVVYIGTMDPPRLVALSAATGKIYWEQVVDSPVISSPAIGDENNLVFISSKGTLYNLVGQKHVPIHHVT